MFVAGCRQAIGMAASSCVRCLSRRFRRCGRCCNDLDGPEVYWTISRKKVRRESTGRKEVQLTIPQYHSQLPSLFDFSKTREIRRYDTTIENSIISAATWLRRHLSASTALDRRARSSESNLHDLQRNCGIFSSSSTSTDPRRVQRDQECCRRSLARSPTTAGSLGTAAAWRKIWRRLTDRCRTASRSGGRRERRKGWGRRSRLWVALDSPKAHWHWP